MGAKNISTNFSVPIGTRESDSLQDANLKEISFMPSTLETIDSALFEWLDNELNIFATTNKGWKKVPIIWSGTERSSQIKK